MARGTLFGKKSLEITLREPKDSALNRDGQRDGQVKMGTEREAERERQKGGERERQRQTDNSQAERDSGLTSPEGVLAAVSSQASPWTQLVTTSTVIRGPDHWSTRGDGFQNFRD